MLAAFALAEIGARVYVYAIAEQGKLFEPDAALGWRPLPHLDLQRRNADGEPWQVRTNASGYRSATEVFDPGAARRLLVLGDSFVFGEGIDIEDRFDSLLARRFPDWSFVNQGVMGYGTDQQLIGARQLMAELGPGDVVLLVTYVNDIADLLRQEHSGRSKPWFELEAGELVEHEPELSSREVLRDRSYVLARIFQWLAEGSAPLTPARIRYGGQLYRRLVLSETADARARGVEVVIAYHGSPAILGPEGAALDDAARAAVRRACEAPGVRCVALDPAPFGQDQAKLLQADGHWAAGANRLVAEVLEEALKTP